MRGRHAAHVVVEQAIDDQHTLRVYDHQEVPGESVGVIERNGWPVWRMFLPTYHAWTLAAHIGDDGSVAYLPAMPLLDVDHHGPAGRYPRHRKIGPPRGPSC